MERFFLKMCISQNWEEVTKDQYIKMEEKSGFFSKFDGEPACGAFGTDLLQGRIEYNQPERSKREDSSICEEMRCSEH